MTKTEAPSLHPSSLFPGWSSLFQLLPPLPWVPAEDGEWGLWSVHNSSSLPFFPPPTSPLLQRRFCHRQKIKISLFQNGSPRATAFFLTKIMSAISQPLWPPQTVSAVDPPPRFFVYVLEINLLVIVHVDTQGHWQPCCVPLASPA